MVGLARTFKTVFSVIACQLLTFVIFYNQSYWPNYSPRIVSIDKEADLFQYVYSTPDCNFRPLEDGKVNEGKENIKPSCYENSSNKKNILLYGDSHAMHLRPGIQYYFNKDVKINQIATFSCQIQMLDHGNNGCIR